MMKNYRKFISLFCLAIITTVCSATEIDIVLKTQTGLIKGSLALPNTHSKTPVILMISGSGPTDRNGNAPNFTNNAIQLLAQELKHNGIASVRYDKRGVAESTSAAISESELRFDHYHQDITAWLKLLQQDDRFSEVIIMGHSEGALLGLIAARNQTRYISIAGSGEPAYKVIQQQLSGQPVALVNKTNSIINSLLQGNYIQDVPAELAPLFRVSVQPYLRSWFKFDPAAEIASHKLETLIINGSKDIQVPVTHAQKLHSAATHSQLAIIENMNHVLKDIKGGYKENISSYSNPNLPVSKELVDTITNFVLQ